MPQRTCVVDDCDGPYHAKDRCLRHYRLQWDRQSRARKKAAAPARKWTCIDCGYAGTRPQGRGPLPKRCDPCRADAKKRSQGEYEQRRDREQRRAYERTYYAANADRLSSYNAERSRVKTRTRLAVTLTCRLCDGEFLRRSYKGVPPSVCPDCDPVVVAERRDRWAKANPEANTAAKQANKELRRAVERGVPFEVIDRQRVFDRDGWMCGICNEPIDPALDHTDPWAVQLDHVIPITVEGASHTYANVQAAHGRCNRRKSNKLQL